jgi:hypothetical protein
LVAVVVEAVVQPETAARNATAVAVEAVVHMLLKFILLPTYHREV